MDEGADWRQRLRQEQEKNRVLEDKVVAKKNTILSQKLRHKREMEDLKQIHATEIAKMEEKGQKEKSKQEMLEKELSKMTKRAERAEINLTKLESVQSNAGDKALFQDVLGNLKDFLGKPTKIQSLKLSQF